MFTLTMHYIDEGLTDGYGTEAIKSLNVPHIGQTIDSDRFCRGTWVVTEVHQVIRDGVLAGDVSVTLRQKGRGAA